MCEWTADAWTVPVTFTEGGGLTDAVQHVFKDPLHARPQHPGQQGAREVILQGWRGLHFSSRTFRDDDGLLCYC